MLDPIAKEVWCEALRSGEFKQGKGALKHNGAFCCLGVAQAVFPALTETGHTEWLSMSACDLLGITDHMQTLLGAMNDRGESFADIADFIEREL